MVLSVPLRKQHLPDVDTPRAAPVGRVRADGEPFYPGQLETLQVSRSSSDESGEPFYPGQVRPVYVLRPPAASRASQVSPGRAALAASLASAVTAAGLALLLVTIFWQDRPDASFAMALVLGGLALGVTVVAGIRSAR